MKSINEILHDYTTGETDLEEANAALLEAGANYHLEPGQNELTEQDLMETTVGYYPEQANGWGLLDTGTGSMEKVRVTNGALDYPVNEVLEDGETVNMAAYVTICGKTYEVLGDTLSVIADRSHERTKPSLPPRPDLSRRTDLAGCTVPQRTKIGAFLVSYDREGYAVEARRA